MTDSTQSPSTTNYGPAVAIVGSRNFSRLDLVSEFINDLPYGTIVVSGGARGVDFEAARYAQYKRLPVKEFRLESFEWHLGKWMGPFRNELIVRYVKRLGGTVVVFVERSANGSLTPGSASTIQHCHDLGCPVIVFDQNEMMEVSA